MFAHATFDVYNDDYIFAEGLKAGDRYQTLIGATGTGKTAALAWTIDKSVKPPLIIAQQQTTAPQLSNDVRGCFPHTDVT